LAFSAKECVYKALFPVTGWPLGFGDVTVDLDVAAGTFSARLAAPFRHAPLEGRLVMEDGYVFTGLALRTAHGVIRVGPRCR
ncbi:MAG TPA: hypothetical protein VHH09_06695, partial [Acidimicrobiales bacterium]|nr:hypothetical protein [Acidimicrobiales bacterium]